MSQVLNERIAELEVRIQDLEKQSKEVLTIEEVSALYGWSRRKVFQLRDERVLQFYRFPNTRRRYLKRSEIEAAFKKDELVAA